MNGGRFGEAQGCPGAPLPALELPTTPLENQRNPR